MNRIRYILKHWKLGAHLLFRTKRFGVNNKWWVGFDSLFGNSIWQSYKIFQNWKSMKFRARTLHFLSDKSYKLLFGDSK